MIIFNLKAQGVLTILCLIEICSNLAAKNNENIKTNQAQHDKTKPIKSILTTDHTYEP